MASASSAPPRKRQRRSVEDFVPSDRAEGVSRHEPQDDGIDGLIGESTIFRNISACSRCRLRKNRCDQRLPSCAGCAKVGVACVGYDVLTKREVPRSYVFYLENRVEQLEKILASHNISFPAASDLESCALASVAAAKSPENGSYKDDESLAIRKRGKSFSKAGDAYKLFTPVSMQPANVRSSGQGEGAIFMSKTFHAIQSDGSNLVDDDQLRGQLTPVPERHLAFQLVMVYFDKVNPQFPILYREEFMTVFNRVYTKKGEEASTQDFYFFYMVLAIGAGHAFTAGDEIEATRASQGDDDAGNKTSDMSFKQHEDHYYTKATMCFERCMSTENNSLKVLQALLLLSSFAILRPVSPGIWYICGVTMRLAVDLSLHQERGEDEKPVKSPNNGDDEESKQSDAKYKSELKRRLWWCTYSFDRLISISLGRPVSISDHDITTPMPSIKETKFMNGGALLNLSQTQNERNCDPISQHFIRLRMLQSEIITASQQARVSRGQSVDSHSSPASSAGVAFSPRSSTLQSPVSPEWALEMERRLNDWQSLAPTKSATGVSFPPAIFEFYYWQTVIVLYQSSLSTAMLMEDIYTPVDPGANNSGSKDLPEQEHEAYLKVAKAGQKVLRMYRHRHLAGSIQYTYSSTHYLFRVSMLYLHAIGKSSVVRREIGDDDMEFTVLVASSIFSDMQDTCPNAKEWLKTFERTARRVARFKSQSAEDDGKVAQESSTALTTFSEPLAESGAEVEARLFPWHSEGDNSSMDMDTSPQSQQTVHPSHLSKLPMTAGSRSDRRQVRHNDASAATPSVWNFDDLIHEPLGMPQGMENSLVELRDLQNWLMLPPDSPDVRVGVKPNSTLYKK